MITLKELNQALYNVERSFAANGVYDCDAANVFYNDDELGELVVELEGVKYVISI